MAILAQKIKSNNFPINFNDVWQSLGYSTKGNGKKTFASLGLQLGKDFVIFELEDICQGKAKCGKKTEAIMLTPQAFELLRLRPRKKQVDNSEGFIYILRDDGKNLAKVGFSTSVLERVRRHIASNPFLRLTHQFPVKGIKVELSLHRHLKPYKLSGTSKEWYHFNEELLATIEQFIADKI